MKRRILSLSLLMTISLAVLAQNPESKNENKKTCLNGVDLNTDARVTEKIVPQLAWVDTDPEAIPNAYHASRDNSISIPTFRLSGSDSAPMPNVWKQTPDHLSKYNAGPERVISNFRPEPKQEKP